MTTNPKLAPFLTVAPEENPTIRDTPTRGQGRMHVIIGPVGAGKSTYALTLVQRERAVRLTLDDWMTRLFSDDRPENGVMEWYVERAGRCCEQIWNVATAVAENGSNVILEIGLLGRAARRRFYERIDAAGFEATIHVLEASREARRARVEERNRVRGSTFSMLVPLEIFELASDLWESPEPAECEGRDVRFVRTD